MFLTQTLRFQARSGVFRQVVSIPPSIYFVHVEAREDRGPVIPAGVYSSPKTLFTSTVIAGFEDVLSWAYERSSEFLPALRSELMSQLQK